MPTYNDLLTVTQALAQAASIPQAQGPTGDTTLVVAISQLAQAIVGELLKPLEARQKKKKGRESNS